MQGRIIADDFFKHGLLLNRARARARDRDGDRNRDGEDDVNNAYA